MPNTNIKKRSEPKTTQSLPLLLNLNLRKLEPCLIVCFIFVNPSSDLALLEYYCFLAGIPNCYLDVKEKLQTC